MTSFGVRVGEGTCYARVITLANGRLNTSPCQVYLYSQRALGNGSVLEANVLRGKRDSWRRDERVRVKRRMTPLRTGYVQARGRDGALRNKITR